MKESIPISTCMLLCGVWIILHCDLTYSTSLTAEPVAVKGEEGGSYNFTCTGPEIIEWKRPVDGIERTLVTGDKYEVIYHIANGTTTAHLTIKEITTNDTGTYTCRSDASSFEVTLSISPVIKLLSGLSSLEGVVEYTDASEAGLICDEDWSDAEATVVCRQLGYDHGESLKSVGLGLLRGTVFYRDYRCNGDERELNQCSYESIPETSCDPGHIAQVACGPPAEFDLRMTGSRFSEQGRVEVFLEGEWGYVATPTYLYKKQNKIICRHLGYVDSARRHDPIYIADFTRSDRKTNLVIDEITCADDAMKLSECQLELAENATTLSHNNDVKAICIPYDSVANHPIRLVDEKGEVNSDYGRIQILHDGIWGTICGYSSLFPAIACAEQGHNVSRGWYLDTRAYNFPPSEAPIWTSFPLCSSYFLELGYQDADQVYKCRHGPWGTETECSSEYSAEVLAAVQCVPLDGYDDPNDTGYIGLHGWKLALVLVATFVCLCLLFVCCWRAHQSRTATATSNTTSYSDTVTAGQNKHPDTTSRV